METRPLKIAMFAGEPSGDRQGAALLAALREKIAPRKVEAWGIGGEWMRADGVNLRYDSTPWATIGIVAALARWPYIRIKVMATVRRELLRNPPDAIVLIDAGAFNVPLGSWVKRHRICPVFYYFPPGSWRKAPRINKPAATKQKSFRDLSVITDCIVTPFPWSAEFLKRGGANAHFTGHPLLDLVKPKLKDIEFYERFGLDPHQPLVAILPGSRQVEITHILPALIGAAGEITRRIPGVQFVLALAPSAPRALVEEIIKREQRLGGRAARLKLFVHQAGDKLVQLAQTTLTPPVTRLATNEGLTLLPPSDDDMPVSRERPIPSQAPLVICEGLTYDAIARSDLVITKSGTSTLEATILQKPMIIVYRGSALMAMEWSIRKHSLNIAHIGLPNILAEERIFPELLQDEATPEAISELAVEVLIHPERMLYLKERLAELVRVNLGEPGAVQRAAGLLYDTILKGRSK